MKLWHALCIASFGHDALNPKRAALYRVLTLVGVALICCIGLHALVTKIPLGIWPRAPLLTFSVAFITQWLVLLALMGSSGIVRSDTTVLRLLAILPLRAYRRYGASVLPHICLVVLTLLSVSWPLLSISEQLGLSPFVAAFCMLIGAASGCGYFFSSRYMRPALQVAVLAGIVAVEMLCSKVMHNLEISVSWWSIAIAIGTLSAGILYAGRIPRDAFIPTYTHVVGTHLTPKWWAIKKIVRASITRTSLAFGFLLSCLCVLVFHSIEIKDPSAVFLAAGCIAASCAADIRSTSRALRPPEITALKGTWFFVRHHCICSMMATLVVSPFIVYAVPTSVDQLLLGLSQIGLGAIVGVTTGSIFASQAGDISGQFMATMTSIAVLGVPLLLPATQQWSTWHFIGTYILTALLALGALCLVEYKRNPFIWRKHVQY